MKTILCGLGVLCGLLLSAAQITLEWDAPASNQQIESYGVWTATNVGGPWSKMTNCAAPSTNIVIGIEAGAHFFFVTASNFWGESEPSNIAWTPAKARPSEKLKVLR